MEETTFVHFPREAESSEPSPRSDRQAWPAAVRRRSSRVTKVLRDERRRCYARTRQPSTGPSLSHAGGQRSPVPIPPKRAAAPVSRSVILSLLVFVLSFAVLFAGPALVLRLMAASIEATTGGLEPGILRARAANASETDSTITLQQGNLPTAGYTGTRDTFISRWQPGTNMGPEARVSIGQDGAYRALVYFDLAPAGIPGGATITSARLGLYCYDRNVEGSIEIGVYQVVRPWIEFEATWQRATDSDPWGTAGCDDLATDRLASPVYSTTVAGTGVFQYFDVRDMVQNWVSNPSSNQGLILLAPDHVRIYVYASSEWPSPEGRPELTITWIGVPSTPTPTPTLTRTPTPTPTQTPVGPTPTRTATPTAIPPVPPINVDNASSCYSDSPPGQWQTGIAGGGFGGSYRYETTSYLTGTATFSPCVGSPLPSDGLYDVQEHWSVHSGRPIAVPYTVHYFGGTATVFVDQSKNASGSAVADFSPSDWHSLGVYPFRAGTGAATGEYVQLTTSSAGDTCADAVRWIAVPGPMAGPPYTVTVSADPTELPPNGTSASTIMVTVTDILGNLAADGTMVGLTTSLGSLPYTYAEAESAAVTKLGVWNTALATAASAGAYIYSDNPGDEVIWNFQGKAVSFICATDVGGGSADIIVDGTYLATMNFASGSLQWLVEHQMISSLTAGPHTIRIRHAGGGRVWLDAFRSGTITTGGVATAVLTAPLVLGTATVRATAIGAGATGVSTAWPAATTTVSFLGPSEVWVDDNYCAGCANGGHIWNYTAFDTIQGGVNRVSSDGIVHVLTGVYTESVTVAKSLSLLGNGSSSVFVAGTDAPGSSGFYVDRADNVTIRGFTVKDFETAIYLRGTGAGAGPRVYNATITGNVLKSDAQYGIRGSYVYTSTLCSNEITLGNNGIYLDNSYGNIICYSTIYNNLGFGVKLQTGNENSIDNNDIYNHQNVGVELAGQVLRIGVYGNNIHDLAWDGILVNGSGTSGVNIAGNTISNTNLTWLDASSTAPDGNHNWGAVALIGITADSTVRDNRISGTSNAAGNRLDASGIYLFNNTVPITIESNLVESGAGHGIYISSSLVVTAPLIHGNSIYNNSRFGLNNQLITPTHAEGNWWGSNVPTLGPSTPADIRTAASAWYSPPISVSLRAGPSTIPANGIATSAITATARGFGYNILDGTLVTFTSDLSTLILPSLTAFGGGKAYSTLHAGIIAGVAVVTGTASPGIAGYTTPVTLTAGAPASIAIVAAPETIPNSCEGAQARSVVTATVRDRFDNPVPGIVVSFSSSILGSVFPNTTTTLATPPAAAGTATTTFTASGLSGTAVVTATAGTTLTVATHIGVTAGRAATMTIAASPTLLPANGVATSAITVNLRDCVGNPVPDGTLVGFTTTLGTIVNYRFAEAESAAVITSTGWTVSADPNASNGKYILTSTPGATAYWVFRGEAVSVLYAAYGGGGTMRVRVDGGTPMDINTVGAGSWVEKIIAANLNAAVDHQIEVTVQSASIALDAFRSGAMASAGVAHAILRAPALTILNPATVYTGTIYATERLGDAVAANLVVTTNVTFGPADMVWVNDDWAGLADGTAVGIPPEHGGGIATIGSDAFDTMPEGTAAVKIGGTVHVLAGTYTSSVMITKTMNLLGDGSARTFVVGTGVTNGLRIQYGTADVYIEGFTIRNFDVGVLLDGRNANPITGTTFVNNVIAGCATGAIAGTYVNDGFFADNVLHDNPGVGIDLWVGSSNWFVNNQFYANGAFGLRIRRTSDAQITDNQLHDLGWDGIVVGDMCTNTMVLRNTVRTTNLVNSPPGANRGGIVLNNSSNTTVEDNRISDVRDAGGITNTAGLWIGNADSGATIRHNYILNNMNDGILLLGFSAGSPPVIHCNHIYGNLRYGLRHATGTGVDVHAEDNWWGHNLPLSFDPPTAPPVDIGNPADVFWDPIISLTLAPAYPTVNAGGPSIVITATACGGGCCILDGTPITFSTNLGSLGIFHRSVVATTMGGGRATITFAPGTVAGTATITGTMTNNGVATTTVTILPLRPVFINLTAYPGRIRVDTTAAITAEVSDEYGNPVLPGTVISFETTLGGVSPTTDDTDANGDATSTLYAGTVPGLALVSGYRGFVIGYTSVEILAGPAFTITSLTADPSALRANGLDTSLITAIVKDQFDNLVPDMTMVGFTTTAGSLMYQYVEAESSEVISSTGWSGVNDGTASGGRYIQTSTPGAAVRWDFRGEAVSIIYWRGVAGVMRVRIDGASPVYIDTSGSPAWVEQVIASDLDPSVGHEIEIMRQSGQILLDAFRSGVATSAGRAFATLTAAMLPPTTARVRATALDLPGGIRVAGTAPTRTVSVQFLQPNEVWVDDDYCSACLNDGHQWGYDAFDNIPAGITAVASGGTVHVADGVYHTGLTIDKPIYLDGAGSGGTTHLIGSGTGNGIFVNQLGDGTTIEGFAITNFNFGMYLRGLSTNAINGITVTNNVVNGCATGAITATFVNDGRFQDNALHDNNGFGFDLNAGNRNRIQNNHIFENAGFGLRVVGAAGPSSDNNVIANYIHDVDWDGIRIGSNTANEHVLNNIIMTTNRGTGGSFDLGGIGLYGTTDAHIEGNTIAHVQNASGVLADTAGIGLDGSNVRPLILRNWIRDNVNHGIWLSTTGYAASGPAEIHGNSIYANGRFGIFSNVTTVAADAEGNWWGHNTPTTSTSASTVPRDIFTGLGANVDYTPHIEMTIARAPTAIPGDGLSTASVSVTMHCATCTPPYDVLDGTAITFTSSLGSFGVPPVQRSTSGGQAFAVLQSAPVLGRSYITATTPLQSVHTWVDFIIGPPFSVTMTADPPFVIAGAGPSGPSTIYVTVTDRAGNLITDTVPIAFDWSPGLGASVSPIATNLDGTGHVTTTFYGGTVAATAWVTGTVGTAVGSTPVPILPASPATVILDPSPEGIPGDGVSTGIISATVRDLYGNLAQDGTMVGFEASRGTLPCRPAEAESAAVTKSPGWVVVTNTNASGGMYLHADSAGTWARWTFNGSAVSLIYERSSSGGWVHALVDGVLKRTFSMWASSFEWQRETVIASGLDPTVPHVVEVQVVNGRVFIDAFRCGATTVNGVATTVLTSPRVCASGVILATAVEHRVEAIVFLPWGSRRVDFTCADVTIIKRASTAEVEPLELVTFTLAYSNLGRATATGVVVTDTLPLTLTYVSAASAPDVGAPSNPTDNVWVWQVGNVLPGASGVITLTAQRNTVPWLGVVTNTTTIRTSMLETNPENNDSSLQLNLIAARPFAIVISATPPSIWVNDGVHNYQSSIAVTVTDQFGNPAVGRVVTFTLSPGFDTAAIAPATRVLNAGGRATSLLSAGTEAGTILVTATVESVSRSVPVEIMPGLASSITLDPWPLALAADGVSTATITATVHDAYGNLAYDGTKVGFVTSRGSVPVQYQEAETSPVITSAGDWIVAAHANASGGEYLHTDHANAWVSWTFTGSAVSLVYARTSAGGSAQVFVDGVPGRTVGMYAPSTEWQREWVMATGLDPNVRHQIELRRISGRVFVDALQSGYATQGGVVTVVLTSARVATTAIITGTAVDSRFEAITGLNNQTRVLFQRADLAIAKVVTPARVHPGEFVTYTLYYTNTGQAQGTSAIITDTLPAELMFVGSQSAPNVGLPQYLGANVWRWELGHVQPGASGVITFTAWLEYTPGLCELENVVSIGSLTLDSTRENNTASSPLEILCANVGITKVASASQPLDVVTFTMRYSNEGELTAAGTVISDTLPVTLSYVSSVSVPDLGPPLNPSDNVWVWQVGNLAPRAGGVITLTAERSRVPWTGVLTNTVTARVPAGDSDPTNNTAVARVSLLPGPPLALTVTTNPSQIMAGQTSTVDIAVTDKWGNPVPGQTVYITTNLGSFAPASSQMNTTRTTDGNGHVTLTFYSQESLGLAIISASTGAAAGEGYILITTGPPAQLVVTADPAVIPADCTSRSLIAAQVRDAAGHPVPDGYLIGFETSFGSMLYDYVEDSEVTQSPLGSWNTGSDPNDSGGTHIYTDLDGASVSWSCHGNGVSIVYVRYPGGGWADVDLDGNPLGAIYMNGGPTWRAEQVFVWGGDPTAAHVLRLTHRAGTGRVYMDAFRSGVTTSGGHALALLTSACSSGTATVAAVAVSETVGSFVPTLVPGFVSVRFEQADLSVTKSVQPARSLVIGQQITFTLSFYNSGPMTATNAYIEDTISGSGLGSDWLRNMFFSSTPAVDVPGLQYAWYLGLLAPGQSGTITFGGTVNERRSWSSLTVVSNTATIASYVADSAPSNNRSSVSVNVVTGPPASLTLAAVPDSTWILTGTSELRAMVRDAYGNPAPNGTPVNFTTDLGGFPSVQQQVGYTTDGLATQVLSAGATAGTAQVTATVGSLVATTQVQFRYVPGAPASIRFLSLEPGVIPDCVGQALATVLVLDYNGNPVRDGTVVSFMVAPTGEANPIDGGRTASGIARAIIAAGMEPVPAVVKAMVGDQHSSLSASFPVTFIVGPPDRLEGLSAQPPQLPVGGNNSTIRVRVLDCTDRYPVTDGTVVTFTLASGLGTLSPFTTTTTNGWAYSTLTSPDDTGSALVRVNAGEREATLLVVYIPGPAFDVVVMPSPLSIAANGVSTSTIVAGVRDQYGNFVADGTRVRFSTTLGLFVTGPSSTAPEYNTSTLGGSARAILISSNAPGVARVGAEAGGKRGEAFVDFYYVPPPTPTPTRTATPTPTPTATRAPTLELYLPLIMRNGWR